MKNFSFIWIYTGLLVLKVLFFILYMQRDRMVIWLIYISTYLQFFKEILKELTQSPFSKEYKVKYGFIEEINFTST